MNVVIKEEVFKVEGFDFVIKRFTLSNGQQCVDEETFKFILEMLKDLSYQISMGDILKKYQKKLEK